jgi:protein ImuB
VARARLLSPELCIVRCEPELLAAARQELFEAQLLVAPQVEWAGGGTFHLDATGLAQLHGSERVFLLELLGRIESLGFAARVGLAGSRFASTAAARLERGLTVVPPGGDAAFLADRPIELLPLPGRRGELLLERLRLLGVRNLGELARLPADALADRFGRELARALRLARGEDPSPLDGRPRPTGACARRELDEPVEGLEPVTFLLKTCCEELACTLARRGAAAARIGLSLSLDDAPDDRRELAPSRPLLEPRALLDLCRLELEARRLAAPVLGVEVAALVEAPVRASTGRLFGRRLDRSRLSSAVDRVRLLLGEERVVTPAPREAHRREARRAWRPFEPRRAVRAIEREPPLPDEAGAEPSERLLPRPLPALVQLPRTSRAGLLVLPHAPPGLPARTQLVAQAGPCRVAGEWWDGGADVDRDEHVLLGADGGLYRAFRDRRTREWFLLGVED